MMPALTGVRFPMALWVVSHHLSGPGRMLDPVTTASPAVHAIVGSAWVALTAFFAISGFVLTRRYTNTTWTRPVLARYAIARVGRVYPLYLVSLLILVPIINEALGRGDLGSLRSRAGIVLNYVLLLQGWQRPVVEWNTPAWSLSCELFFYACFPLIMLLVRVGSWPRLFATTVLAFALPVILRLLTADPMPKALLYFGDFLVGVAAAGVYDRLYLRQMPLRRLGPWLTAPALIGGLALVLFRDAIDSFFVFDAGIRLTSAILVFGLACGGGLLVRTLSSPLMMAGGRASYAIYILHVPVLWWYQRSALHAELPRVQAGFVYIAIVLTVSYVLSRWFEAPANDIVRAWYGDWWRSWFAQARGPGGSAGRQLDVPRQS